MMRRLIVAVAACLLLSSVASAQEIRSGQLGLGAWSSDSPAPSCGSGTLTTATVARRWSQVGKTVFVGMAITLTTVGTCGSSLIVGLPVSPAQAAAGIACRDNAVNSVGFIGAIAAAGTTVGFVNASGTFAVSNGMVLDCSGVYESQ